MRSRCVVCGGRAVVKARCRTCYEYRRRHGHDRPFELIAKLTEKDIAREHAAPRVTLRFKLG
jgi:hypothetical protein